VGLQLTDLGFATTYEIDVDPELPAAGVWGAPAFRFGSRSGRTLTIRIRPSLAEPWVASFALETSERLLNGLYACPNPDQLLVATGADAYLVSVGEPGRVEDLPIRPVVAVRRAPDTDLLVIGSFTNLAAVDEIGLRWVTDRLFLDDLDFVEGPPGQIGVRGSVRSVPSEAELLIIDPARGDVIEGPWDPSIAGPYGQPGWRRSGI